MDPAVGGTGQHDPLAIANALHRHQHASNHQASGSAYGITTSSATSYKDVKEAWIADQTGSSIYRVNILGLVMLSTYILWAVLRATRLRFLQDIERVRPEYLGVSVFSTIFKVLSRLSDWQLEFVILVVPAISGQTILSSRLLATNITLLALSAVLFKLVPPATQFSHPASSRVPSKKKRHWSKKYSDDEDEVDEDDNVPRILAQVARTGNDTEIPFRVSIDSAADAAHAAAAPPTYYSEASASSSKRENGYLADINHRGDSPQLTNQGDSFRSPENTKLLSPDTASTAIFPVSSSSLDSAARRATSLHQSQHSRDGSDAQSVVSNSSLISPLARSVIDPLAKAKHPLMNPSASASIAAEPTSTSSLHPIPPPSNKNVSRNAFVRTQPFLTVYRAHMMLVTIISILAVDFPVFPREFSKCESWGTSWMDMGVGSFVFSLGIISALPFLRSPQNRFKPLRAQLISDLRKSLPLLALGSVRIIMVKGVEYPEHVTEYGVHWNFFITLALLPFAATLSRPFSKSIRYSVLGLTLSAVHQALLSLTWLQDWALSNTLARNTLASQNKEGLTSLPGYLSIFFLGLDLGHYVLPLDPYFAYRKLRKRRSRPKTGKLAMVLASFAILWWGVYALASLLGLQTSRRLANLPYVLWVAAFNTSFLLCYVLVYLWLLQPIEYSQKLTATYATTDTASSRLSTDSFVSSTNSHSDGGSNFDLRRDPGSEGRSVFNTGTRTAASTSLSDPETVTPRILSDLNRHSLSIFLIANLLTGLVNVSIQSMYTRDSIAFFILLAYTGTCLAAASFMTSRGIRLRL